MSQADDTKRSDRTYTLPIDAAGEIARYKVADLPEKLYVELRIDGDEAASYTVEFGSRDIDDSSTIHWFEHPDRSTYASGTTFTNEWDQSQQYLRIRVTDPAATAGSEARIVVSYGSDE